MAMGLLVPNNLPVALSSFVGRERELGELGRLLEGERLVTLTGAGGCGKTRLALQTASKNLERFPDGAWWVELAPLGEAQLVGAAIAESLGVRPLPGLTELQAAGAYLGSRRALVVLDNCEHLLEACAAATESLLKAAPEIVVLATSRAPLGADGETDWRVPSLTLPEPTSADSTGELAESDAVSLFAERARRARPGFALNDQNARYVAAVCSELDGLPLAIELAAARVRLLSVEQIAVGVSDRFRLLTGGPRTAVPRLQTLRASVDWSHALLSEDERVLLRRLAVFVGGFALGAVEEVCGGERIQREQLLDLLAALVDQSLVVADEDGHEVRYRLLETIRQYGLERLADAGEGERLRDRHRDFFLRLAEQAGPDLETGRQGESMAVLDPEAANMAAAIEWALGSEPALALRFCVALSRWWLARGRLAEAELLQSRSLEACGDAEPGLRARVLRGRAMTATLAGRHEAAGAHTTEALALAEEVGDKATAGRARGGLGAVLVWTNPQAARAELTRAAELARDAGDDWGFVYAKQVIAQTYEFQGDHVRAVAANDEVAGLAERIGEPFGVARRWLRTGLLATHDGRMSEARDAAERGRTAVEAVGEPVVESLADAVTAIVDIWEGAPERALARLGERLESRHQLGAGIAVPPLLAITAFAEVATGRHKQACDRLEALVPLIEGRDIYTTTRALYALGEGRRLMGDGAAESAARRGEAAGELLGNRLLATQPRLTLGRMAAARGDWTVARQHALAHLDACAEGGHTTYVPSCLDALAEIAEGVRAHEDAVRLFAAAERARAELGIVRFPPEKQHWASIEAGLLEGVGSAAYLAARAEGAELSIDDAVQWARRMRGARSRPLAPRGIPPACNRRRRAPRMRRRIPDPCRWRAGNARSRVARQLGSTCGSSSRL
jgi:predicted ATPase